MNNLQTLQQYKNNAVQTFFINPSNSNVDYANGKITYALKTPTKFPNSDVALKAATLYYSWNTISDKYNNTQFSIIHDTTEELIDITPGLYDINSLNQYLQFQLDSLGLYSTITNIATQTETRIYYLKIEANTTYNRVTLTADVVPETLPVDTDSFTYSKGPNLTLTGKTMQLKVLNNNFQKIIGFNVGSYPSSPSTSKYMVNGQNLPHPSPVEQIFVLCNLVFEGNSNWLPSSIANFPISAAPRGQFEYERSNPTWQGVQSGTSYETIELTLVDQSGQSISYDDGENFLIELEMQSRF